MLRGKNPATGEGMKTFSFVDRVTCSRYGCLAPLPPLDQSSSRSREAARCASHGPPPGSGLRVGRFLELVHAELATRSIVQSIYRSWKTTTSAFGA